MTAGPVTFPSSHPFGVSIVQKRFDTGAKTPNVILRLAHAFVLVLATSGWLSASPLAQAGTPAQAAIQLDTSEIIEYWYWASGVVVTGSGFAASSNVAVTATDPNGGIRRFAATTDASGAFSVRVNAMKLHSVLGEQVISATDSQEHVAQVPLAVIHDPDDVLQMATDPAELTLAQFTASGAQVRIGGLVPNARVRINLGDPADNIGELMNDQELYADADGEFDFVLDPNTQISGAGVSAVVPTEGVWTLSAFDFSGDNEHHGTAQFRMLPNDPSADSYCAVNMTDRAEPITLVGFAGIDNPSPIDSTAGYEDFTGIEGQVTAGQTYAIHLQGKAWFSFNDNTYTVFADWNHDGILDEPQEIYSAGSLLGSTGADGMEVVYNIAVPEGAASGPTRMRVLKVLSPSPFAEYWPSGACGNYRDGQVEDYTVVVAPADGIFDNGFDAAPPPAAPTLLKMFSPPSVATNAPSRLTITLANTNATAATLTADLVDAFPNGLAPAATASTTCTGGPGLLQTGTSVTLQAGAAIPAAGSCTISVDVAGQVVGDFTNTIPAGGLATDAGSNAAAATATLTVTAPVVPVAPTLTKSFSPSSVAMNTPTRLTITLANTNTTAATLTADLVDAFPTGLVSAANASTTCTGGSGLLQTGTSVTLQAGATIPAAGSCTIGVDVAAQVAGDLTNTIPAGALATDAGSNAAAATATLTVASAVAAPTLTKSFSPSSVAMNTPTRLMITLANTNATAATLTADLVDAFPSGLVSAASATTTCTGGAGLLQTGTSVTLQAGATIPAAGSCTIGLDVAGQVAGDLVNTIAAGGLATDAGSNAAAATATLSVAGPVAAPTLTKSFSPSSVATNTPTRLTITLANTNATAATLTADLVDAFPAGLVSAANASTTCTGGPGLQQSGTSVTLRAGATIPAAGSCTIGVDVAGQVAGNLVNTIPAGGLATDAGSNAAAASATLAVAAPVAAPTLTKSFSPSSVATNTPTRLTITLANTNATAATLTADLVDAFPSGLVSAANASTTCTGGPGLLQTGTSVTLRAGATVPAAGSCTIGVDVAGQVAGNLVNTIPAGGLATDAGSNAAAATATLTVASP